VGLYLINQYEVVLSFSYTAIHHFLTARTYSFPTFATWIAFFFINVTFFFCGIVYVTTKLRFAQNAWYMASSSLDSALFISVKQRKMDYISYVTIYINTAQQSK